MELLVSELAFGGAGVARHDGFVVLVPRTVPGDQVCARIVASHPGYATGRVEEILVPSPDRVAPRCRHFDLCGGCAYQHLPPLLQAQTKANQVREALHRIGARLEPAVLDPITAPSAFGYRTRVELTAFAEPGNRIRLGYHRQDRPGEVFAVEECAIAAPAIETLRARLDEALGRSHLTPFDTRTRRGFLRRVVLRCSSTGDTLVELRTARPDPRPLKALVADLISFPGLQGIVQVLDRGGRRSISGPSHLLWGRSTLRETLAGLRLEFPAGAFAQTHAAMMEILYREALRAAGDATGRACLDLFCGAGALSLLLERAGAREVMGIESDGSAAGAASRNARANAATRCRFVHAEVESALQEPPSPATGGRFELAVLNPPRPGLSARALQLLVRMAPECLAYVSCDPATLARDLRRLAEAGYRIDWVRPLDLFPQTAHVETVSALVRNRARADAVA